LGNGKHKHEIEEELDKADPVALVGVRVTQQTGPSHHLQPSDLA
jgi:2C-methyl-D-erythritol 2,4-cyclodiphosphate synthase